MPSVLPRSSMPMKRERVHSLRRIEASACGMLRASEIMSANACSAAAMVLPVGELTTAMPCCVAASTSMLSTPTPARPMPSIFVACSMMRSVTFVSLRTTIAS